MSIAAYDLRPEASYTSGVPFSLDRFRSHLKAERKARAGGRDDFAEAIGVNKTTIQNAENGPDVPKIDTLAKMVEGMGLTLSEFFAQMESLQGRSPRPRLVMSKPVGSGRTADAALTELREYIRLLTAQLSAAGVMAGLHDGSAEARMEALVEDVKREADAQRKEALGQPRESPQSTRLDRKKQKSSLKQRRT